MTDETIAHEELRHAVREGYARIAEGASTPGAVSGGCCGAGSCSPDGLSAADSLARRIGYAPSDLEALPPGTNLGLSCGNPTSLASLQPGLVVLDLGSGAGFDCFIAGPRVGPTGRVIGVDMTPQMVARARRSAVEYRQRTGLDNVEFRLGEIEHLPVADASVDVVISNCVLNLSADKPQVWREIARVLKPGGRVAVSDLALLQPLPDEVRRTVEALVGCVAGAVSIEQTRRMMEEAGLTEIVLTPRPEYVESLRDVRDPLWERLIGHLPPGSGPQDYITSLDIQARRPLALSGADGRQR